MKKVAVVCGFGISSRFMTEKLKQYVNSQGILMEITAANEYEIPKLSVDVILVGAPLRYKFETLKKEAEKWHDSVKVVLIGKEDYEDQNAESILRKAFMEAGGETDGAK